MLSMCLHCVTHWCMILYDILHNISREHDLCAKRLNPSDVNWSFIIREACVGSAWVRILLVSLSAKCWRWWQQWGTRIRQRWPTPSTTTRWKCSSLGADTVPLYWVPWEVWAKTVALWELSESSDLLTIYTALTYCMRSQEHTCHRAGAMLKCVSINTCSMWKLPFEVIILKYWPVILEHWQTLSVLQCLSVEMIVYIIETL